MKKGFQLYLIGAFAATTCLFTSCNSSDTWGTDPQELSGVAVKAFSLKKDNALLHNLDSVFFSIDLVEGRIFNANPLPCETNVSAIAVSISSDAVSVAQLIQPASPTDGEQVIDYLASPDHKINFENGPVRLHLVSADGARERDYYISLNVAQVEADSLYWDKLEAGALKTVADPLRTKTVKCGDRALCLSVNAAGNAQIASFIPSSTTGGGVWDGSVVNPNFVDVNTVAFGNALDVESLTATGDGTLFILDSYGNLHSSADQGATFHIVASGWVSISAPYLNGVLGVADNAGAKSFVSYPAGLAGVPGASMPASFPIKGHSAAATFTSKWSNAPQVIIAGGRTSSGTLTGASWAFDGNRWAQISDALPPAEGYAVSQYTIAQTDTTTWRTVERPVLIAFGGNGLSPVNGVYISKDMGVNWQKGNQELQLPDYIPFATGAQLLVFDKQMQAVAAPLAIKPIETWQCPYLYLFGGYNIAGQPLPNYWSGVVNHLKFRPLQ